MRAEIIAIGDELLIGQIVNTNATWIAQRLNELGISVVRMTTVADEREAIRAGVQEGMQRCDLVLITGGLGPTKDDITKHTLAELFGMELAFHEQSFANIERLFASFGRVADERYRVQAAMPVGATVLINTTGTASGMWFEQGGKIVVSMPGVPREMQYLMQAEVLPRLLERGGLPVIVHRTLQTMGKGETDLSDMLEELETKMLPAYIKLAYLPDTVLGRVRLRLTGRGADKAALEREIDDLQAYMLRVLGTYCYAVGEQSIEEAVGLLLLERGATLGSAESCTGGNIARRITALSGCSAYFQGSAVVYSNELKMRMLGVKAETLDEYGAVSEQTVSEMAKGVLERLGTDYAVATSGIAGPGGGRPDKPVGTIWVAVASKNEIRSRRLQLGNDRHRNVELASSTVLNMLRLMMMGVDL